MPDFFHDDEVAYLRWLYALFRYYCEIAKEEVGFDRISFRSFQLLYERFYMVSDVVEW